MNTQALVARGAKGRLAAVVLAAALLVSLSTVLSSPPAHAAARVEVSPAPNADGSTTVTLSGSGFQYVPNAPGGIYIFFGAVSDPATNAWAPSQGGRSGTSFGYSGTDGSMLLAAFQGGTSADAANAVIGPDGSWTAQMTIPGSRFASSSGNPHAGQSVEGALIDCLQVQCGIITIGAHGAVNANNESFTPVGFVTADGSIQSGTGTQSFTDDATVLELSGEQSSEEATKERPANRGGSGETPTTDQLADGGSTLGVLIVLGIAVLALLAAVATVVLRRSRDRRSAARPALPETGTGEAQQDVVDSAASPQTGTDRSEGIREQ